MDSERGIAGMTTHPFNPIQKNGLPKTNLTADSQYRPESGRHRNLMTPPPPNLYECPRITKKVPADVNDAPLLLRTNSVRSSCVSSALIRALTDV